MPKGYIDCHKCRWSHKLYDFTGKATGTVFCSKRNGKLKKRFRKECLRKGESVMTNKEAIECIDNLIICIKEHPIVADWLVEIANRKTEPSDSEKPNNCEVEPHTEREGE